MVKMQNLMALGAGSVIVLAAAAQSVIPPCCKYLWEWPAEENPYEGACSGWYSTSCQSSATNVWGEDPLARKKGNFVEAQCFSVVLGSEADFYRLDCSDVPPPGAHFIGVLPNGTCCYAAGYEPHIDIEAYSAGYWIRRCDGACDEFQN